MSSWADSEGRRKATVFAIVGLRGITGSGDHQPHTETSPKVMLFNNLAGSCALDAETRLCALAYRN